MKQIASHVILLAGSSFENSKQQVTDFFARTELVRYDYITIDENESLPGTDSAFIVKMEEGQMANKSILAKLVKDLESAGMRSSGDLLTLEQGYPSKVLHIITHLLDGFIGIDTVFYNLLDDSHWVPSPTEQAIKQSPKDYWLIQLHGYSDTPEKAALVQH